MERAYACVREATVFAVQNARAIAAHHHVVTAQIENRRQSSAASVRIVRVTAVVEPYAYAFALVGLMHMVSAIYI